MGGQGKNWTPNVLTKHGYVGQSGMPTVPKTDVAAGQANGLMVRGIVINVYVYDAKEGFTTTDVADHQLNTLYADVALLRGGTLPRCEVMQERGGLHEGGIWIPRAASIDVTGAAVNVEFGTNIFDLDGDYVIVGFLEDDLSQPFIMGTLPHPNSDKGHDEDDLGTRMRLVDADGQPRLWKHRGAFWGVDDAGNWLLDLTKAHEGSYKQDGTENAPAEDGTAGNITVKTQAETTLLLEMGANISLTITESDGKIIVTNTGDTEWQTDGEVKIGTGASEHVVLGDKYKTDQNTMNGQVSAGWTGLIAFLASLSAAGKAFKLPADIAAFGTAVSAAADAAAASVTAAGASVTTYDGAIPAHLSTDVTSK